MKPAPFDYVRPTSVEEALETLQAKGFEAQILAGGQSLVPLMNLRLAAPTTIVDIMRIDELQRCHVDPAGVTIGAGVRQAQVEDSPEMASACPLLTEALPLIAHRPIRNAGTVCGSLAHADPAAELPAVAVALGAELTVARSGARRKVNAADFYQGYLATVVEPEELVTAARFPALPQRTGSAFLELATRAGDFALVGVAATVSLQEDGTISQAAIGAAGVDQVPFRCRQAEQALVGHPPSDEVLAEAAAVASTEPEPASDVHAPSAYRRDALRVLTRRALALAGKRVREV